MKAIHRLDLGGTASYNARDAVAISYDGSVSDSRLNKVTQRWESRTHVIIGDYNRMPFPSEQFDEAFGSCYLEGSDAEYMSNRNDLRELYRVLKPGAKVFLRGCAEFDFEGTETCNPLQQLFDMLGRILVDAGRAGFSSVVIKDGDTYPDPDSGVLHIDTPTIHLVK